MIPLPVETVWSELQKTATLDFVAAPVIKFRYKCDKPEHWAEGQYPVEMLLFGIIPLGEQTIAITFLQPTDGTYTMRDDGFSNLISKWEHQIKVEKVNSLTRYTDTVEISAGMLTPLVWLFASCFFYHRQNRWKKLAQQLQLQNTVT